MRHLEKLGAAECQRSTSPNAHAGRLHGILRAQWALRGPSYVQCFLTLCNPAKSSKTAAKESKSSSQVNGENVGSGAG